MLMTELDGHTITDPGPMEHPSMTSTAQRPYRGVFPVAPTIFDERGELDLAGQRRCIDFMIDAGSNGLCILANFSEQFVLTDAEREGDACGAGARRRPGAGHRDDNAFRLPRLCRAQPAGPG